MADIKCAKCGEPTDAYGVRNGNMTPVEAKRFLAGEGCPSCRFGTGCPACDGSGRESHVHHPDCKTCRDKGYILAWSPQVSGPGFRAGEFYTGYVPNVRHLPDGSGKSVTLGVRVLPEQLPGFVSRDGAVHECWRSCPDCEAPANCAQCEGTGKLKVDPDAALEAAKSECDWSDEDPMEILIRRGVM